MGAGYCIPRLFIEVENQLLVPFCLWPFPSRNPFRFPALFSFRALCCAGFFSSRSRATAIFLSFRRPGRVASLPISAAFLCVCIVTWRRTCSPFFVSLLFAALVFFDASLLLEAVLLFAGRISLLCTCFPFVCVTLLLFWVDVKLAPKIFRCTGFA